MKVLLVNRSELLSRFGGDTIKTLKTKEYLEKIGVDVDLALGKEEHDISSYDLIHIFNLQNINNTPWWVKRARVFKKPVVISTILWRSKNTIKYIYEMYRAYHPRYSLPIRLAENIFGRSASWLIFKKLYSLRFFSKERFSIDNANVLIVESRSEIENLMTHFKLPKIQKKAAVVLNGINEAIFAGQRPPHLPQDPPDGFVLTVGRIEPPKNQINIIKALFHDREIPLLFIGAKNGPKNYITEFEILLRTRPNTFWIPEITQEQLGYFYRRAKVYLQPSVWETLGSAIFEAAAFGCNLVITEEGGAKDYFREKALYCNPSNLDSIKSAVKQALSAQKDPAQAKMIKEQIRWEKMIAHLYTIYKEILG